VEREERAASGDGPSDQAITPPAGGQKGGKANNVRMTTHEQLQCLRTRLLLRTRCCTRMACTHAQQLLSRPCLARLYPAQSLPTGR
jgi:hypothetical protein